MTRRRLGALPPCISAFALRSWSPTTRRDLQNAANAFLATKLSFTNACGVRGVGADVNDVLLGMGYDHRIGHEFLRPGPAGAVHFPKDSKAIISIAEDAGYGRVDAGVVGVNLEQFDRIVRKVEAVTPLEGVTIGVLGIAFKAGTDDTRESPAIN